MKTRNHLRLITFTKRSVWMLLALMLACGLVVSSQAQDLVSNTWNTGDRTYPAPGNPSPSTHEYSEMGVDANSSLDLESAWFVGGSGTLGAKVGTLLMSNAVSSSSFTTYFADEAGQPTLGNAGDFLKVTWVFTPRNVNLSNTSQGFNLALVNTPSGSRLTLDGVPPGAVFAGYAMFMNMGVTIKNSNPFQLREWGIDGTAGNILAQQGNWANLANGATSGTHGYDSGTSYKLTMTLTLLSGGSLEIKSRMDGGTLNGVGFASIVFTDSTPNSLTYDTFSIRPSLILSTADSFDTTLFEVQFVPEPSTLALVGIGLGLMAAAVRRRRHS